MGRCELTGKGPVVKNLVSHSNIKTKSISQPNIQKKRLFSQTLGQLVTLRIAASTIRDMEHVGGLDKYILNSNEASLSKRALAIKSRIRQRMSGSKSTGTKKAAGASVAAAPEAAAPKKAKKSAKATKATAAQAKASKKA
jgi:large subunit ribosomal protein L28